MGLYFVQVSYKAFVYSVKLKCEIGILNRLVDFVKSTTAKRGFPSDDLCPDFGSTLQPQNWNDFQLSSQMQREWETTLRNTFGVPMEAAKGPEGAGGSLDEKGGPGRPMVVSSERNCDDDDDNDDGGSGVAVAVAAVDVERPGEVVHGEDQRRQ